MLQDFTYDWDEFYTYATWSGRSKPPKTNKKKANIFIRMKWSAMILCWKFNNRKWNNCRQKEKAYNKFKKNMMKGYEK